MNLGQKIDKLFELREEKYKQKEKVSEIQKEFDQIQAEVISRMENEDLEKAAGDKATATLGTGFYPSVEDIEKFVRWITRNKKFEFIQKRVSKGAAQEMLDSTNKLPPGVKSYNEAKLNLRRK
jgi:hypothetical protein